MFTPTLFVFQVEQGTHTDVVKLQDNASETTTVICDSETLTERISNADAQTSVDIFMQTVETLTDECCLTDTACMTDAEWFWDPERDVNVVNVTTCDVCSETRTTIDTATSPVSDAEFKPFSNNKRLVNSETQTLRNKLYDKSVITSFDYDDAVDHLKGGILCADVSTSTENLPYIGLLSEMDCDELILVPEIAFDVIGSDEEYRRIYSESFPTCETSAQTVVSSATIGSDVDSETLGSLLRSTDPHVVTIGVNTEHTLTFEKETWTPSLHQLAKGTNTSHAEKSDKSTSTESNVRTLQENLFPGANADRMAKLKVQKHDISTETDNSLLDEKMIACINKLKTVSDRLNSPTTKMFAESMPWGRLGQDSIESSETVIKELDKVSESERKKNVMDLVARSKEMAKVREPKTEPVRRKAQPLTSLKTKQYQERAAENDKPRSKMVQRQDSTESNASTTSTASSKTGSQTPVTSKRVNGVPAPAASKRSTSTPGRIATVPNQAALRKPSPRVNRKTPPATAPKPTEPLPPPESTEKQYEGPEFYSTVPKTRHPKHGLSSITENRHSATGSLMSGSDKGASSGSVDKSLDFSSLKINAPQRAPSASPTPPRHQQNGRPSRQMTSPNPIINVVPSDDDGSDSRMRTGSTSSDQTDYEPSHEKKGFMKKLFGSKKKKSTEKRNHSPSKSPKQGRKALAATPEVPPSPEVTTEKPKEKQKPFVYMRSRIFSIEQKDDDKYNKPLVNKYCINEEKPPVFDFAATFTKKK